MSSTSSDGIFPSPRIPTTGSARKLLQFALSQPRHGLAGVGIALFAIWGIWRIDVIRAACLFVWSFAGPISIPALVSALDDESEMVHIVAGSQLNQFGRKAIPALERAIRDSNSPRQEHAIRQLNGIYHISKEPLGDLLPGMIEVLREALRNPSPTVRFFAARALWDLDGDAEQVRAMFYEGLYEPDLRAEALQAPREFDPNDQDIQKLGIRDVEMAERARKKRAERQRRDFEPLKVAKGATTSSGKFMLYRDNPLGEDGAQSSSAD